MEDTLLTAEEVAKHRDRLLALAHRLSSDPGRAEDLVQETYLAVLQGPVRRVSEPGAWLAGILRKLNLRLLRHEGRTGRSERLFSVSGTGLEQEDREDLREIVRDVVGAMGRLREPYRSTLLLRYLEERSPAEIAARVGIPVRTVHTRTNRGLDLLREQLDRRHGSRAWNAAWLALLRPGEPTARAAQTSGLRVAAVAAVGVAFVSLVFGVTSRSEFNRTEDPRRTVASRPELAPPPAPFLVGPDATASRRPVEHSGAAVPEPRAAAGLVLSGRVVDLEGRPQAGVEVQFVAGTIYDARSSNHEFVPADEQPPCAPAHTDEEGAFEITVPEGEEGLLEARDEARTTAVARRVGPPHAGLRIVVAQRHRLTGRVLDEHGAPVADVRVRFSPGHGARQWAQEHCVIARPDAETDREGRFEIANAHRSTGAALEVWTSKASHRVVPLAEDQDGELVIEIPSTLARTLRGLVVDESGHGVSHATIVGGGRCVPTAADGRFELTVDPTVEVGELRCFAPGALPVVVRPEPWTGEEWPDDLRIVVAQGSALAIEGRVVDADGSPAAGVSLALVDPTAPGAEDVGLFVEDLIGARSAASGGTLGVNRGLDVTTDAAGRFRVGSLLDRAYRLCAFAEGSLLAVESPPIRAGARDVLLQLPRADGVGRYGGKLVTANGAPMAGVLVVPSRKLGRVSYESGRVRSVECTGRNVVTDAEGRFEFDALAGEGCTLRFFGDGVYEGSAPLPPTPRTDLVVTGSYAARLLVMFEGERPPEAWIRLRMSNGQFTSFFESPPSGRQRACREAAFDREGWTEILLVPDVVTEVVVYVRGREPLHVPVELHAGELSTLAL